MYQRFLDKSCHCTTAQFGWPFKECHRLEEEYVICSHTITYISLRILSTSASTVPQIDRSVLAGQSQ